jgi:predicted ATP-dependent serine protease
MTAINRETARLDHRGAVQHLRSTRVPLGAAPPEDSINSSEFDTVVRSSELGASVIMVLGGAGTGKTTSLHKLWHRGAEHQVFLAPNGVAALQLGCQRSIPSSAALRE